MDRAFVYIGSILIAQAAGLIGTLGMRDSLGTWYPALKKPFFNPPGWIFGPVWGVLYLMMGIAAARVYEIGSPRAEIRTALILFSLQLAVNVAWSFLFLA